MECQCCHQDKELMEGSELCGECYERLQVETYEPEEHIVTREMALDAGDPALEGQTIRW